jgi:hypothetical protein
MMLGFKRTALVQSNTAFADASVDEHGFVESTACCIRRDVEYKDDDDSSRFWLGNWVDGVLLVVAAVVAAVIGNGATRDACTVGM